MTSELLGLAICRASSFNLWLAVAIALSPLFSAVTSVGEAVLPMEFI